MSAFEDFIKAGSTGKPSTTPQTEGGETKPAFDSFLQAGNVKPIAPKPKPIETPQVEQVKKGIIPAIQEAGERFFKAVIREPANLLLGALTLPNTRPEEVKNIEKTLSYALKKDEQTINLIQEINQLKLQTNTGKEVTGRTQGIAGTGIFARPTTKDLSPEEIQKKENRLQELQNQYFELQKKEEQDNFLIRQRKELAKNIIEQRQEDEQYFIDKYGESKEWTTRWVLNQVADNSVSTISSVAVSAITAFVTRNPQVALAVGFGNTYVQESSGAYQNAISQGLTEQQALDVANKTATINATIELLPLGDFLTRKEFIPLRNNIYNKVQNKIINTAITGGIEGTTESVQEFVANVIASEYEENPNLFEGIPESFLIGLITGSTFDLVTPSANKANKPIIPEETLKATGVLIAEDEKKGGTPTAPPEPIGVPKPKPEVPTVLDITQKPIPSIAETPTQIAPTQVTTTEQVTAPQPTQVQAPQVQAPAVEQPRRVVEPTAPPTQTTTQVTPTTKTDAEILVTTPKTDADYINTIDAQTRKLTDIYKNATKGTQQASMLKGLGMEMSALKRAITGNPTATEISNKLKKLNTLFKGREVTYQGKQYKVQSTAFGRTKIVDNAGNVETVTRGDLQLKEPTRQDAIASIKQDAKNKINGIVDLNKNIEKRKPKKKIGEKKTTKPKKEFKEAESKPKKKLGGKKKAEPKKVEKKPEDITDEDIDRYIETGEQRFREVPEADAGLLQEAQQPTQIKYRTPNLPFLSDNDTNRDSVIEMNMYFESTNRVLKDRADDINTILTIDTLYIYDRKIIEAVSYSRELVRRIYQGTIKKDTAIKTADRIINNYRKRVLEKYRVAEDVKAITGKDINKNQEQELIDLNKRFFGDDNVRLTLEIITNKQALGAYYDNIIEIVKGQANPKDTFLHEAVHKYVRTFSGKQEIRDLFRAGMVKYKTTDLALVEERIAEDFIQYYKDKQPKNVKDKVLQIIQRIAERINIYTKNKDEIETLYDNIISGKAKEIKEKKAKPKKPTKKKAGVSAFQQRVSEQLLSTDPSRHVLDERLGTYDRKSLEVSAKQATDYLEKNPKEALAVSLGIKEAPKNMEETAIAVATAYKAKQEGDLALWADIINHTSQRLTRLGREIVQVRGTFTDDSPENYIRKVIERRTNNLGLTFIDRAKLKFSGQNLNDAVNEKITKDAKKLKERLTIEQTKIASAQSLIDSLRC